MSAQTHSDTPKISALGVDPAAPAHEDADPRATSVVFAGSYFTVMLRDDRRVDVPLKWYPRLFIATPAQRSNYELCSDGEAIYWPDVDEDIRVASLLEGRRSGESRAHFRLWYERHQRPTWEAHLQARRAPTTAEIKAELAKKSRLDALLYGAYVFVRSAGTSIAEKLGLPVSRKRAR